MNIETQKRELIAWLDRLKDSRSIEEFLRLKEKIQGQLQSKRSFGGGKDFFSNIADDFNDSLDDLSEPMSK